VARGGTYSVEGDKIHAKPTMALNTFIIGVDLVLKVTRLDKSTMIGQYEFPPSTRPPPEKSQSAASSRGGNLGYAAAGGDARRGAAQLGARGHDGA